MYDRFSDAARKIMGAANEEPKRFNHEYVGTEHVLLAICGSRDQMISSLFQMLDIDPRKVKLECEKLMQPGPDIVTTRVLPLSPRTKKVIEYAIASASELAEVTPGHIMYGLIRETEGFAAQVLMNLGVRADDVREAIVELSFYDENGPLVAQERELGKTLLSLVGNGADNPLAREQLIQVLKEDQHWRTAIGAQLAIMINA